MGTFRADIDDATLRQLCEQTNPRAIEGTLEIALQGADVLLGFGRRRVLEADAIGTMAKDPIVFAMANPYPEVDPSSNRRRGARNCDRQKRFSQPD